MIIIFTCIIFLLTFCLGELIYQSETVRQLCYRLFMFLIQGVTIGIILTIITKQ